MDVSSIIGLAAMLYGFSSLQKKEKKIDDLKKEQQRLEQVLKEEYNKEQEESGAKSISDLSFSSELHMDILGGAFMSAVYLTIKNNSNVKYTIGDIKATLDVFGCPVKSIVIGDYRSRIQVSAKSTSKILIWARVGELSEEDYSAAFSKPDWRAFLYRLNEYGKGKKNSSHTNYTKDSLFYDMVYVNGNHYDTDLFHTYMSRVEDVTKSGKAGNEFGRFFGLFNDSELGIMIAKYVSNTVIKTLKYNAYSQAGDSTLLTVSDVPGSVYLYMDSKLNTADKYLAGDIVFDLFPKNLSNGSIANQVIFMVGDESRGYDYNTRIYVDDAIYGDKEYKRFPMQWWLEGGKNMVGIDGNVYGDNLWDSSKPQNEQL